MTGNGFERNLLPFYNTTTGVFEIVHKGTLIINNYQFFIILFVSSLLTPLFLQFLVQVIENES
jgi:hypothetical protein